MRESRIFHGNYEQYTKRITQASVNITEQEFLRLQTKLTEIVSRISIPNPHDDITFLEQEYEKLLVQIQKCKGASDVFPIYRRDLPHFPRKVEAST